MRKCPASGRHIGHTVAALMRTHGCFVAHDVPKIKSCPMTPAHVQVMMVMEYMQGGDLGTALARDTSSPRRLGWYNRGRHIALGIARGLMYLHAQKVAPLALAAHFRSTRLFLRDTRLY